MPAKEATVFYHQASACLGFPGGSDGKESAAMQETQVWSLGQESPPERGMATHSSIFAWVLWTKEPGRLQSMESQSNMTELTHMSRPSDWTPLNKLCLHKKTRLLANWGQNPATFII